MIRSCRGTPNARRSTAEKIFAGAAAIGRDIHEKSNGNYYALDDDGRWRSVG